MTDLSAARKKAWETRRAVYGAIGHAGCYSRTTGNVGRMIALLVRLMREGVLSEGQVSKATGLGRVEIRKIADDQSEKL